MQKVIKLKESDLQKIVKRVLTESYEGGSIQKGDKPCDIWCKIKLAKSGSNGDVVKMIQHLLSVGGFNEKYVGGGMSNECIGKWQYCDGKYRKHTKDAVMEFQRKYKLKVDGVVGYNTLSKMCEVLNPSAAADFQFNLCQQQCKCDKKQKDKDIRDDRKIDTPIGGGDEGSWWDIIKNPIGDIGDIWDIIIGDNPKKHCEQVNYCIKKSMDKKQGNWEFFLRCIGKKIDHPITNPNPKKGCKGCPKYVWGGYQVAGGDKKYWERKKFEDECLKNKCSEYTRSEKLLKDHPEWFK
jgi:hypothetical protein